MPYVLVEVYVEPADALAKLDDDELEAEIERRKAKRPKLPKPPETVSLKVDDLEEVSANLALGDVEQAMLILERILPERFRYLSLDVRRFYSGTLHS